MVPLEGSCREWQGREKPYQKKLTLGSSSLTHTGAEEVLARSPTPRPVTGPPMSEVLCNDGGRGARGSRQRLFGPCQNRAPPEGFGPAECSSVHLARAAASIQCDMLEPDPFLLPKAAELRGTSLLLSKSHKRQWRRDGLSLAEDSVEPSCSEAEWIRVPLRGGGRTTFKPGVGLPRWAWLAGAMLGTS